MMNKNILFNDLSHRKVWIPCHWDEEGKITLELLLNNEGKQFIPAFYAKNSKLGAFDENKLLEIEFSVLRHMLIDLSDEVCGIVLEAFDDNIALDRIMLMEFDSHTKGMSVERNRSTKSVSLMVPKSLPNGLKEKVKSFLEREIGVNGAWILLAKSESEGNPYLLFLIDFFGNIVLIKLNLN